MKEDAPSTRQAGPTSLLIVDDQVLCSAGLVALFRTAGGFEPVDPAHTADEALRAVRKLRYNVVLLDVTLPDCGSFRVAQKILARHRRTRIVFLDERLFEHHVHEALRSGGAGYWTKEASFEEVEQAVRRAAAGEDTFCPAAKRILHLQPDEQKVKKVGDGTLLSRLTAREIEVMTYLAQGLSVKQCAERMKLSRSTVDNHKSRLMKKLNIHKTVELVLLAIRAGLIPP